MKSPMTLRGRQNAASDRIDYLDAAKGFFILTIITEHHLNGAEWVNRYLYSMGVPSFFLISGFLYAYKKEWEKPFGKTCVRKFQNLLYPYVTFSVINLLWHLLYYKVISPGEVPSNNLEEMLRFTLTTYGYNALWYLPIALWGTLVFLALRRVKHHGWIWAAFSLGLVVFYVLFDKKLTGLGLISYIYCYLFRISVAVVLIYAGSALFTVFRNMNRTQENLLLLICAVFSAVVAVLYQLYPEQFDYANVAVHRMGNPYVYFPAAISNTIVVMLLCKKLPGRKRLLSYFGRNSLILMALHMDVTIRFAWWLYPKFHVDFGELINSLLVIGMELLMFPVIITVINIGFPFLLSPGKVANRKTN